MYREDYKSIVLFVVFFIAFLLGMSEMRVMQKTRAGERLGSFTTVESKYMPMVLFQYLKNSSIRYHHYNLPNHLVEFFTYNSDFKSVYEQSPKSTVIKFVSYADYLPTDNIESFYNEVYLLLGEYKDSFNYIEFDVDKNVYYPFKADNYALKDLREYCSDFCVINPTIGSLFTFAHLTISEKKALPVLFQQYSFYVK